MKTHIIAVYDRVTKQYTQLMNPRNIERIEEEFKTVCENKESQYYAHPQDYEVHHIGNFNDSPHHDPHVPNELFTIPKIIATGKPRFAEVPENAHS